MTDTKWQRVVVGRRVGQKTGRVEYRCPRGFVRHIADGVWVWLVSNGLGIDREGWAYGPTGAKRAAEAAMREAGR